MTYSSVGINCVWVVGQRNTDETKTHILFKWVHTGAGTVRFAICSSRLKLRYSDANSKATIASNHITISTAARARHAQIREVALWLIRTRAYAGQSIEKCVVPGWCVGRRGWKLRSTSPAHAHHIYYDILNGEIYQVPDLPPPPTVWCWAVLCSTAFGGSPSEVKLP